MIEFNYILYVWRKFYRKIEKRKKNINIYIIKGYGFIIVFIQNSIFFNQFRINGLFCYKAPLVDYPKQYIF